MRRLSLPILGASDASSHADQRAGTLPVARLRNWRVIDPKSRRPKGGTRPVLRPLFNGQTLGNGGPVQALRSVSRTPILTGFERGPTRETIGGRSKEPSAEGNVWILDTVPSIEDNFVINATASGTDALSLGATSIGGVQACAITPNGNFVAFASNYTDTALSRIESVIQIRQTSDMSVVKTINLTSSARDRFVNTMVMTDFALIVCTNERVEVYNLTGTTGPYAVSDLGGWSDEAVQASVWETEELRDDPLGTGTLVPTGVFYVYVGFNGSSAARAVTNSSGSFNVTAGNHARHFGAGVMRFELTANSLTKTDWGDNLPSTDQFYEAAHGYFRIADNGIRRPYGAEVTGLASDAQGNVFISTTNIGLHPDSAIGGSTVNAGGAGLPPFTVWKIAPNGSLEWQADTESIIETTATGENDIPDATNKDPSINAVCADNVGDVYVGGRQNEAGDSVFKLDGRTGAIIARQNLMTSYSPSAPHISIRQACCAYDQSSGDVIFGGDRQANWFGANTRNAHIWRLRADDLGVQDFYDVGQSVSALCVALANDGQRVYGTDYASGSPTVGYWDENDTQS